MYLCVYNPYNKRMIKISLSSTFFPLFWHEKCSICRFQVIYKAISESTIYIHICNFIFYFSLLCVFFLITNSVFCINWWTAIQCNVVVFVCVFVTLDREYISSSSFHGWHNNKSGFSVWPSNHSLTRHHNFVRFSMYIAIAYAW